MDPGRKQMGDWIDLLLDGKHLLPCNNADGKVSVAFASHVHSFEKTESKCGSRFCSVCLKDLSVVQV